MLSPADPAGLFRWPTPSHDFWAPAGFNEVGWDLTSSAASPFSSLPLTHPEWPSFGLRVGQLVSRPCLQLTPSISPIDSFSPAADINVPQSRSPSPFILSVFCLVSPQQRCNIFIQPVEWFRQQSAINKLRRLDFVGNNCQYIWRFLQLFLCSFLLSNPFFFLFSSVHRFISSTIIPVLISVTLLPFFLDLDCSSHFALCPLGLFALNGHLAMTSASLRPPPCRPFSLWT